ncbi:MAG: TetR/AcrR family transcriptional regulator [Myxococcaceae bacterium]|nr:TetR/AcrR family transcriptional regulator [Myxococcaceae bacterium]
MSSHSPESQRAAQKAETRRRILEHARRLCARRGFARTRTVDVAKAARVSHGSVFVHFPSREALMAAVVGEMAREITDALHALGSQDAPLREVLAKHLDCLADREDELRWLLLEAPLLPKGFDAEWVGVQSAVAHHIAEAAARDMAAGRIREIPLHLLFNTWIGLVHHYVIHRELFAPGRSALKTHGRELLDHFMGLISTPTPKSRSKR